MGETELEIETTMVLAKKLKVRTITGQMITGLLKVFECESPYVIILLIDTEFGHSVRADIHKEDLSLELRLWLEGKTVRNPVIFIPSRIEDAINNFVKFGKTPLQEDLIFWLLSRSELQVGRISSLEFGGNGDNLVSDGERHVGNMENQYIRNANASLQVGSDSQQYRIEHEVGNGTKLNYGLPTSAQTKRGVSSTTGQRTGGPIQSKLHSEDMGMFEMTRKLLGKSTTLEMVKKSSVKGREGARKALPSANWSSEQYALVADIEKARKNIEQAMDERRRMIEIAKIRQIQSSEKFRKIRDVLNDGKGANKFVDTAKHELASLQKMEADILEDIRRQKIRAQRSAQKVSWTMAPSGFVNRRGKTQRGPVLGNGPLNPNATSALRDPRLEETIRKYYWDSAGRRHVRDGVEDRDTNSLVEKAMEAIRRAAQNIAAFKLDLKVVFEEFDTSGDGFLSPPEMAQAFLSMGVKLDIESMQAIFKHFDPNDSGSVHYGEFVWAFFNRRGLVRQWKRKTSGLTDAQIKNKFHASDINGDGRLNAKEFRRLLKSFGMDVPQAEIEIMIERFDVDGDGDIDLNEFRAFIESEQKNLADAETTSTNKAAASAAMLPQPKYRAQSPTVQGLSKSMKDVSALPVPPPARTGLNKTAPARPQSAPRMLSSSQQGTNTRSSTAGPSSTICVDDLPTAKASTSARLHRDADVHNSISESKHSHDEFGDSTLDPLWMSRVLQAQAEIESRLGNKYYH